MHGRHTGLVLLILLVLGIALVLLLVLPDGGGAGTGPNRAAVEDAPIDGSGPRLRGRATRRADADANDDAGREDDEDVPSHEFDDLGASLQIHVVDGRTGSPVAATWNIGSGRIAAGPFPPGAVITEEASIAQWNAGFLPSGGIREETFLPDDDDASCLCTVRPSPGYVLEDPELRVPGRIAAGVLRIRVVVPVWPEAVLDVVVLDAEGRPARDVEIGPLFVDGQVREDLAVEAKVGAPGRYRIRGIPGRTGQSVLAPLVWGWSNDDDLTCEEISEAGIAKLDSALRTEVPRDLSTPWRVTVRLRSPRSPVACYAIWDDGDLPYEESLGEDGATTTEAGAALEVHARTRNGEPILGATVLVDGESAGETNADGVLSLTELTPTRTFVRVEACGRFPMRQSIRLSPGGSHAITLEEPEGATVEVRVTDADGYPLPFAKLSIPGRSVFDVRDDEQRLDLYTDADGRRFLARVEPGRARISARSGRHRGSRVVDLPDGETVRVHIVVE